MEEIKKLLDSAWGFVSDMLATSKYQAEGIANINLNVMINEILERLKSIYEEVQKYEEITKELEAKTKKE